jgi:hypothetical protein
VYIPWQIEQDISRSRLEDTTRAASHAYRNAESCRRPMRRIASILRWVSERVEDALPRRTIDRHTTAIEAATADDGRSDLRLTVVATNAREDFPVGTGAVLEGGQTMTLVHTGRRRTLDINDRH